MQSSPNWSNSKQLGPRHIILPQRKLLLAKLLLGLIWNMMDAFRLDKLFAHTLLNFSLCWIPGLFLVKQFLSICRQTADRIELKFGGSTHYRPPLAWLSFGCAPLKFCPFLASDWPDWAQIWWAKSLRASLGLIMLHWIFTGPLIGLAVSMHFWTNDSGDWAQASWIHSLW